MPTHDPVEATAEVEVQYRLANRRDFIAGMLACGCSLCLARSSAGQQSQSRRYCFDALTKGDIEERVPISQMTSADLVSYLRTLVDHVKQEDAWLLEFFQTRSVIYLELQGKDAHTDKDYIGLGLPFVRRYAPTLQSSNLLKISGILAHEKGHVYQVSQKLDQVLADVGGQAKKYTELHADYLAGAYMAWRERLPRGAAAELSKLFFDLGDRAFNSEDHHGTESERHNAYTFGYWEFKQLIESQKHADVEAAAKKGLFYVHRLLRGV